MLSSLLADNSARPNALLTAGPEHISISDAPIEGPSEEEPSQEKDDGSVYEDDDEEEFPNVERILATFKPPKGLDKGKGKATSGTLLISIQSHTNRSAPVKRLPTSKKVVRPNISPRKKKGEACKKRKGGTTTDSKIPNVEVIDGELVWTKKK